MIRPRLLLLLALLSAAPLAAQDMPLGDVLLPGEDWQLVAKGYKFTEGPAVDAKGDLYFTDIPNNRIHKVGADGKVSVFAEDTGAANGLFFGPDGRLYACQNSRRKIVAYSGDGKATTVVEDAPSNDLVIDRRGGIYFTDPDNKLVWYAPREGQKRVVDRGINFPNGIILWPDGGTLVVSDTRGEKVWTFRVEPDGSLVHKEGYSTLHVKSGDADSGADGMTVDATGRLYVTSRAGLQVFDPNGRLSGVIRSPQRTWLSNVVFAGPALDTLYVTCGDAVYRRKTKATGVRYFPAVELRGAAGP